MARREACNCIALHSVSLVRLLGALKFYHGRLNPPVKVVDGLSDKFKIPPVSDW